MKPTFIMMCGLPGSWKSSYAEVISEKNNSVICSSDAIREELFGDVNNQDNNEEVFKELHKRVKENLSNGRNVIYDACNINSKRRKTFLDELKKIPCEKQCIIMASPYEKCLRDNKIRRKVVPDEVITKMYKNWQTPYYFEGWDKIAIFRVPGTDRSLNDFVIKHIKYNQDNSHHTLSLGEHSLTVAHNFEKPMLYYAGLLHDCGKPFTKSFTNYKGEISEDAHYYGHECVGAYESLFFRYPDEDNINELDISILINLHMRPYFWEKDKEHGEKTREKYRKLWGEELYQNVMKLHEADKKAH